MNDVEKKYSTYEGDGLAVGFVLKKFCHYIACLKFKLFTDHEALKHVINTRYPTEA